MEGENDLMISCPAGTFKGSLLTSPSGLKFVAYRGIPFGLPPVGDYRFRKPQPQPKLEGIFDASQAAPISLQPLGVEIEGQEQEDCLYLNVFTPSGMSKGENNGCKKVMIYIHGGAFFMGSGNEYVPGDLVAQGDIIVITFNYRLAWLGFLKGKTSELPGNLGYWDQLMAMQWVKDNIKSFGGDCEDITLAGQSMGGESVSVWSILEQGKHLFTKGIVMSGTIFTCPSKPGSSDVLLELLLERLKKCPEMAECSEKDMGDIIKRLRNLPAEAFCLPPEGSLTNKFTSIDGELFPKSVSDLVSDKKYLSDVGFFSKTFLVSLTNHEGAPFTNGIFAAEGDGGSAKEFLSKKVRVPLPVIEKAYEFYSQPGVSSTDIIHDIWSDPILAVPTFDFMDIHSAHDKGTTQGENAGKSYFLWFDHMPSYLPKPHTGTFHSLDLTYIFDFEPSYVLKSFYYINSDNKFTAEDVQLKSSMIKLVSDFVKYGNPGKSLAEERKIEWAPYNAESQHYLNFKTKYTVKKYPLKARRDFWTEHYPK